MAKATHADTFTAVGGALNSWSTVELILGALFCHLSGMPDEKATALFDTIISFETRMAVIDCLFEFQDSKMSPVELEMWNKLSDRLSKVYRKRHEVAHFVVGLNDGSSVLQPFLTLTKINRKSAKQFTPATIYERSRKFIELGEGIVWFAVRTHPEYGTPLLQVPPEPAFVTRLRELAIQSLEERQCQPQPLPEAAGD